MIHLDRHLRILNIFPNASMIFDASPGVGGRTAANGRFHLEGPGLAIGIRGSTRFPSLGEAHAGAALPGTGPV